MKAENLFIKNGYVCFRQQSKLGFDIFWTLRNTGWAAYAGEDWPLIEKNVDPFTLFIPLCKTGSFRLPRYHDLRDAERCMIRRTPVSEIDVMVHDLKSEEASDINNRGKEAQIEYLLGQIPIKEE